MFSFKRIMTVVIAIALLGILGIISIPYVKGEREVFKSEKVEDAKSKASETKKEEKSAATKLEEALKKQDVYAFDAKYVVQHNDWKALYPDMLQALVKNNTDKDIRDIQYGFVAWDKNGLPIKIKGSIDFGKSYLRGVNGDAVNIPAKGEFGKSHGFEIEANIGINTFKPIVVSYTDFDGKKWENPELDEFKRIYEGKRLKDIKDGKKYVFHKDGKAKQPEKVEDKELPTDLDEKKFDEISKNIKAKSEISKEELEAYLAYLELMGLLAYLDAYEELYGIDDVYGYYGVDEVDPGEYNFDEYDFEDYGYEDEPVESDTVEAEYQESSEESYDEPVTEESVETSIEDETVEDFTNEEVTEEYIEPSEESYSAPESTGDYLDEAEVVE
ncbi:DUF5780 domain-containing protein [Macrococcus armenti]|uniref:DUF5780 domain-containing protein n=1 Tax=Macrococcus armenti TaxID=2875764 RepID=UPI001CCAF0A8|nr:DUF5780 domain-containing protein [Macrococcus armenti]UBH12835.1 DUF5780 domain-containing protein [Macrococcus armenti]